MARKKENRAEAGSSGSLTVATKKGGTASALTPRPRSSCATPGKLVVVAVRPRGGAAHPFAEILGKYEGPEWEALQAEVQRQRERGSE